MALQSGIGSTDRRLHTCSGLEATIALAQQVDYPLYSEFAQAFLWGGALAILYPRSLACNININSAEAGLFTSIVKTGWASLHDDKTLIVACSPEELHEEGL